MSDGIYSALSGAVAQQRSLEVVANNVANAGTTGYRADRITFQEVVAQTPGGPTANTLHYVAVSGQSIDETSGPLMQTGNPLDVALNGDAYFAIETGNGERYTRAGAFLLDAEGTLMTHQGNPVLGANEAPITVPTDAEEILVTGDGAIVADGEEVGRFRLVRFADGGLTKEGASLLVTQNGAQPEEAVEDVQVLGGYLESANVSPIEGMNELIEASRAFDAFQRVIQAFKQIDERTAREVGASG